jgi:hypothetical protein
MRHDRHVVELEDRVIAGQRLGVRDVQPGGPNDLVAQGFVERLSVDDAAASDIH